MTASDSNSTSSTEKLILRALVISVLLHLLIFSLWRVGQAKGWWQNFAMPRWMQLVTKAMMPVPPKTPPLEAPSESQLTFVEVDPALATPQPPKNPKFEGAKNTLAANREIKTPSEMPNLDGQQEQYLQTTDHGKPKPTAPAPSPPPTQAPTPTPPPTPPPAPTTPQNIVQQNAPQKTVTPGDSATGHPADKPHDGQEKSDVAANQTQTQPTPQTQPQPQETHYHSLSEVPSKSGNSGQRSRFKGGVSDISPNVSLDVKGTPLGDYIAHMVDAVDDHWHKLLDHEPADLTGKVVLRFRLHSDGTVSDVRPLKNEVSDLLEAACERGVMDPAPFGEWPPAMRLEISKDYYDITFTFYYELY